MTVITSYIISLDRCHEVATLPHSPIAYQQTYVANLLPVCRGLMLGGDERPYIRNANFTLTSTFQLVLIRTTHAPYISDEDIVDDM